MTRSLPEKPSLRSLRYEAKQLVKQLKSGDTDACQILRLHPRYTSLNDREILTSDISLQHVQHALAMVYGFSDWDDLLRQVSTGSSLQDEFVEAARTASLSKLQLLHRTYPQLIGTVGGEALQVAFRERNTEQTIAFLVDAGARFEDDPGTQLIAGTATVMPDEQLERYRTVFTAGVADGGQTTPDGWSLLHSMAEDGCSTELTKLVLQFGGTSVIDTVPSSHPRDTPLQLATERRGGAERRERVAEVLLEHGAYYDAFSAAARDDVSRLRALADQDPDSLVQHHLNGSTPLHWAAVSGSVESIAFLITRVPDMDVRDRGQCTPLIIAAAQPIRNADSTVYYDIPGVIELLISHGANVNAQDAKGRTALFRAAWCGNGDVVKLLLEAGADDKISNCKGKKPSDVARMGAKFLKNGQALST